MTTYEKIALAMAGAMAVYSYNKARKEAIAECCD